jgi:Zn-dependent protease with chaperone function
VPGYPDWCEDCGWNLQPPPALYGPHGRFGRIAEAVGRRSGDRMARELLAARELEPRWTPAKLTAYAVAGAVYVASLALIGAGIAGIVLEFPNVLSLLLGATILGIGWLIRPRLPRLEDDDLHRLDPAATPALHELVAVVAQALDRPPPDLVVVDASWNAAWTVVGLRRRRVLLLGLPFLAALEPQERVALIAHEVGHDRNGDGRRGLLVGSAVEGISRLADVLQPPPEESGLVYVGLGPVDSLAGGLMWLVSRPVDAVLWLEARLLLRDMQRAEYLADALAARVAGTRAAIALEERALLAPTFALAVQQTAHANANANGDVLEQATEALHAVPDRERERRRRVARLEHARLEDTHPPSGMRIAMLEGRPVQEPEVILNSAWSERIDVELEPLRERIGRDVLDAYRGTLYSG